MSDTTAAEENTNVEDTENAKPNDAEENGDNGENGDGENNEGNEDLGEAGKKALNAMKAERNAARREARERQAELDKLKADRDNDGKPAAEQEKERIRSEARAEATAAANKRIIRADVRAAAKGKLADPADALAFLDLEQFEVTDDGDTDSEAITDAIDELLAKKPHLGAGQARRFEGGADQGAKGKPSKPSQLSKEDIDKMSPTEVQKAYADGRLQKLIN
jgi:hypothetical protein